MAVVCAIPTVVAADIVQVNDNMLCVDQENGHMWMKALGYEIVDTIRTAKTKTVWIRPDGNQMIVTEEWLVVHETGRTILHMCRGK